MQFAAQQQSLAAGRVGVSPNVTRRWALVLLHTLVPYALERTGQAAVAEEPEPPPRSSFAPGRPRELQESRPEPGQCCAADCTRAPIQSLTSPLALQRLAHQATRSRACGARSTKRLWPLGSSSGVSATG